MKSGHRARVQVRMAAEGGGGGAKCAPQTAARPKKGKTGPALTPSGARPRARTHLKKSLCPARYAIRMRSASTISERTKTSCRFSSSCRRSFSDAEHRPKPPACLRTSSSSLPLPADAASCASSRRRFSAIQERKVMIARWGSSRKQFAPSSFFQVELSSQLSGSLGGHWAWDWRPKTVPTVTARLYFTARLPLQHSRAAVPTRPRPPPQPRPLAARAALPWRPPRRRAR